MGKAKSKKRRRSSTSDSSSSSSSSDSERVKKLRKLKKKLRKEQKKTEKILKKKIKEEKRKLKKKRHSEKDKEEKPEDGPAADIPIELMETSKAMAPMTKEEWEQRQSVIRKVLDEETGRYRLSYPSSTAMLIDRKFPGFTYIQFQLWLHKDVFRLIKGDGEVLEEIVPRERHKQINRQATQADGAFFQSQTVEKKLRI